MPQLSQIWLYPIKSLAGIRVQHANVIATGLQYDRQWMLVDNTGHFLSQRRLPKMALIRQAIIGDELVLSAPGQSDFQLPLQPATGEAIEISIWHDQYLANACSPEASQWFSDFLASDCRLVYHPEQHRRQVDQRFAKPGDQTAFSDGFPFLVISEASLNAFNQAAHLNVSPRRFRPNLVIADCPAFAEDIWRKIRINGIDFRMPKPCSRCAVPGVDPDTAEINKNVLNQLNRLRRWDNKVYFGQNALHDSPGFLSEGNTMDILEAGQAQPPIFVPSPETMEF